MLPTNLPELITRYRQFLVERSHHLRHEVAERYADAEIEALKRRFRERDNDFQAELVRRMNPPPVRPERPSGDPGPGGYPPEPVSEK